jgi:hypothetical protein
MRGTLRGIMIGHIGAAFWGGVIAVPLLVLTASGSVLCGGLVAAALVVIGSELLERYLYFAAVAPNRMPGRIAR